MPKRQNLDREGLEVHLLNLLLGYRPLLLLAGLLFLIFSFVTLPSSWITATCGLGVFIFLILLTTSYQTVVYTSKALAWVGTLRKNNEST